MATDPFKLPFMKGAGYLCSSPVFRVTQLSPSGSGGKKTKHWRWLFRRGKTLLPTSLPRFRHTATFFCVYRLVLYPPSRITFPLATEAIWLCTSKCSSWLIFTHRESGQASSYSSAPLPPLQDPPGSGPPAFLHIWAVSSWRLPSILGGLIFGTI